MKVVRYGRYEVRAFAKAIEGTSPFQYTGHVNVFDLNNLPAGPVSQGQLDRSEPFVTQHDAESAVLAAAWPAFVKGRHLYLSGPVPDMVFVISEVDGQRVSYEATQTYPPQTPTPKVPFRASDRTNHEIAEYLAPLNITIDIEHFETEWIGDGRYVRFYRAAEGKVVAVEDGKRTLAVLRTFIV